MCHMSFTGYLHWMRHEVSHGEHPKLWYCGEINNQGETCHVVSTRAKAMRVHLLFEHFINIITDIEAESCKIGPSSNNYWCGFCRGIIEVEQPTRDIEWPGIVAWTYNRIGHMAEHFRSCKDILDWIALDNINT